MGSFEKYLSASPSGRERWKAQHKEHISSYNQQYYANNKKQIHKKRASTRKMQSARKKNSLIPY